MKRLFLLYMFLFSFINSILFAEQKHKLKVAINGFGRIGRSFLRAVLQSSYARERIQVIAINTMSDTALSAYLFKYDTVMGTYAGSVYSEANVLFVDGMSIQMFDKKDPEELDWGTLDIDWVVEATGKFYRYDQAYKHIKAGAKKVLISSPSKDKIPSIILGVNEGLYDSEVDDIVSIGSCTTNAFAPMVKILHENFGVQHGTFSTVHAYTNTQAILDANHSDPRRSRAAPENIIPSSTGAAKLIGRIIPEMAGRLEGSAWRVPVSDVSVVDFTFVPEKTISVSAIKKVFEKEALGSMYGIIGVTEEPLVSSDFKGCTYSVVIDFTCIRVVGNIARIVGWYDNEWGYSSRLRDFLLCTLDKEYRYGLPYKSYKI